MRTLFQAPKHRKGRRRGKEGASTFASAHYKRVLQWLEWARHFYPSPQSQSVCGFSENSMGIDNPFEQVEAFIASDERQQLPEPVDAFLKAVAKLPGAGPLVAAVRYE